MADRTVIEVSGLTKSFAGNKALKNVSLSVREGEMVALLGPSGSGKSTLLRHLAGLTNCDRCEKASVTILGERMISQGRISRKAARIRSRIGYIFQQFNLIGRSSVLTNVLIGLLGRISFWRATLGLFTFDERRKALAALQRVGLGNHAEKRASQLSGGQQQRVAIARTMLQQADVLLADEPIASLDPESSRRIMTSLRDINQKDGKTVVVTLHQVEVALEYCSRVIALKDGAVFYDGPASDLSETQLRKLYGQKVQWEDKRPQPLRVPVAAPDLEARAV